MIKEFFIERYNNVQDKRILDVGSHNGEFTDFLTYDNKVTRLDIKPFKGKNFIQADIRKYEIWGNDYDLIIARNILPFLANKQEIFDTIEKLYKGASEYLIFTLFGEEDDWAKNSPHMTFVNKQDIDYIKTKYPVYSFDHFKGERPQMNDQVKNWEIYTFILKK